MAIGPARVERRLRAVLQHLKRLPRNSRLVALSALAEGSDRLFASAALELGYELRVLLPFPPDVYETTFSDAAATPHFRVLMSAAAAVEVLPGSLASSKSAYEAVGRLTVERAHILVAVWDGKPAAGRGGTPEIMQFALDLGRPVIWIDAVRDCPPLLLRRPSASGQRSVPLVKLARRACRCRWRSFRRQLARGGLYALVGNGRSDRI
jgi:hypothetical protein